MSRTKSPASCLLPLTSSSFDREDFESRFVLKTPTFEPSNMKKIFMIATGCICNIMVAAVFGAFGTHVPYFLSYLRVFDPTLKYSDIALLVAFNNVAFNTLSWCSGFMIRSLGIRQTATVASVLLGLCTSACYFALQSYWAFVVLTSCVAFFSAIIQATVIVVCMEWGKRHKGVAIGIISFSEGIGSTIFSVLGTMIINPGNLPTNTMDEDGNGYFGQPEILNKIPYYFLGLGVATTIILLPTSLFIQMPPPEEDEDEFLIEESEDIAYVRSVRSLNYDMSHASFPDYKATSQLVRKISYSQSSCKRKDIEEEILDESMEEEESAREWCSIFCMTDFYVITTVYSAAKICRTILYTYYKAYGLTVISNDQFLTVIAVASNFATAIGRLFWGAMSDKFRSKYLIIGAAFLGVVGVEATYWCLFSSFSPHILYMLAISLDGVIFASQILFTTCLYTFFGKKDFGIKYGLIRAGPGLAVLGFSSLLKFVTIFEDWNIIYHSMAMLCGLSGILSLGLSNHPVTKLS